MRKPTQLKALREIGAKMTTGRNADGFFERRSGPLSYKGDLMNTEIQGWPICAKCNKPVDAVENQRDDIAKATRITAKCHGETHTIVISDRELHHLKTGDVLRIDGMAFAGEPHKRVEHFSGLHQ